ncbi:MAG: methyltransferase domain-containing protein [Methanomassiliicoccales archaeon]|jgi:ubiquinone/menaquinone biosynthesis C-methylase UbiE
MIHRFDVKDKGRLVDEERQRIQPAEGIVHRADPSRNEICADIGCGIGYVTIPLSKVVGLVVAVDSQREMLATLTSRANVDERKRIAPVLSRLPSLPIRSKILDRVVVVNVMHEVEDRETLVSEIIRMLKIGGRVTLVDFQKTTTSFGPRVQERIEESEIPVIFEALRIVARWSYPEFYQFEFERT